MTAHVIKVTYPHQPLMDELIRQAVREHVVKPIVQIISTAIPARADEGDWGCCAACAWAGSEACDECEEADLFEPAEDMAVAA